MTYVFTIVRGNGVNEEVRCSNYELLVDGTVFFYDSEDRLIGSYKEYESFWLSEE